MFEKKRLSILAAIIVLAGAMIFGQGCAAPEPVLGTDVYRIGDRGLEGVRLGAVIKNVDDTADIWVLNATTFDEGVIRPVMRAEWNVVEGSEKGELTRFLDRGVNYVVFTLFNEKFSGWSPHKAGGKYSAHLRMYVDDAVIYNKHLFSDYNKQKLIFAAVFKVIALENGRIRVVSLNNQEQAKVENVIKTLIKDLLHNTAETATVNWREMGIRLVRTTPEYKELLYEWKRLQKELTD